MHEESPFGCTDGCICTGCLTLTLFHVLSCENAQETVLPYPVWGRALQGPWIERGPPKRKSLHWFSWKNSRYTRTSKARGFWCCSLWGCACHFVWFSDFILIKRLCPGCNFDLLPVLFQTVKHAHDHQLYSFILLIWGSNLFGKWFVLLFLAPKFHCARSGSFPNWYIFPSEFGNIVPAAQQTKVLDTNRSWLWCPASACLVSVRG